MTLSDSLSSVSWRLNELLQAGKKARAFAKSPWGSSAASAGGPIFSPMQPRILDGVPEGARETEALDLLPAEQLDSTEDTVEEPLQQLAAEPALVHTEEALEQAAKAAEARGYQRGLDEGNAKWAEARQGFLTLVDMFRSAQANTAEFYQPLLHLSLHLAQQLVRGELSLSSAAVERLIKGVLEDLEQQGEGSVVVYMNPLDRQSLSASLEGELDDLDLRGDQQLCRGSLRLSMDDSAIEDLLEHRLNSLSDALLGINIQPDLETEPKFANPVTEKIIQTSEPQALNSQVSEPQSELSIETEINDPEQGLDDEPAR